MDQTAIKSGVTELVSFHIGDEEYGIEILKVKEIIRPTKTTQLPNAPDFIEGVINLRGTVIPIVDLRQRFKLGSLSRDQQTRVIIVDVNDKSIGIEVDQVKEVIRVETENINDTPDVTHTALDQKYVQGIAKKDDRLIIILDVDQIFSEKETSALEQIDEHYENEELE